MRIRVIEKDRRCILDLEVVDDRIEKLYCLKTVLIGELEEEPEPNKDFEFFMKTDFSKYAGKFIAICGGQVVAGTGWKSLIKNAKKKFPDKQPLFVGLIPKKGAVRI